MTLLPDSETGLPVTRLLVNGKGMTLSELLDLYAGNKVGWHSRVVYHHPGARVSKKNPPQVTTRGQDAVLYALAGCVDVSYRVSEMRSVAVMTAIDVEPKVLALWLRNRINRTAMLRRFAAADADTDADDSSS